MLPPQTTDGLMPRLSSEKRKLTNVACPHFKGANRCELLQLKAVRKDITDKGINTKMPFFAERHLSKLAQTA